MKEITVDATLEHLSQVQEFVEEALELYNCPMKHSTQILIAVEEIYVNIAHYAYKPETGKMKIGCMVSGDPLQAIIEFQDSGSPFDPLAKKDTDTTLPADERDIGGLGILMVKRMMDDVKYEYRDSKNILTIIKNI